MRDIYSDIDPRHFSVASSVGKGYYHVFYLNGGGEQLREVKCGPGSSGDPIQVPQYQNYKPAGPLAVAYDDPGSNDNENRSRFYVSVGQNYVIRLDSANASRNGQLKTADGPLKVSSGSGALACVRTGRSGKGSFCLYYLGQSDTLCQAKSPDTDDGNWTITQIAVEGEVPRIFPGASIAAYADTENIVLAYSSGPMGEALRIIRTSPYAGDSWAVRGTITDCVRPSAVAIGTGGGPGYFSIFYRKPDSRAISRIVYEPGSGPAINPFSFGTAMARSALGAVSIYSGKHNHVLPLAASTLNDINTLFQFHGVLAYQDPGHRPGIGTIIQTNY